MKNGTKFVGFRRPKATEYGTLKGHYRLPEVGQRSPPQIFQNWPNLGGYA